MTEAICEFIDSRGATLRVDPAAGVIRGIKILGLRSRNGREYLPAALDAAAALYEGAKVNVNHPKGHLAGPRDYQDRIGVIRHVAVRVGEGLFGDLFFNPKHALAEQLAWDAQHAPENVGLSHNVEARTARRGETLVVEAITKVQSVDLVADPATTRGLFETQQPKATPSNANDSDSSNASSAADGAVLETDSSAVPDLWHALCQEQASEIEQLRRQVAELKAAQAGLQQQVLARRLLAEFQLPPPDTNDPAARAMVGPGFLQSLLDAPGEAAMRQLVEERAALLAHVRHWDRSSLGRLLPRSRDQTLPGETALGQTLDVERFVRAIT